MSGKDRDPDRKSGRRRGLTRDDRELWSRFTRTIDPLQTKSKIVSDDEADDDGPPQTPPRRTTRTPVLPPPASARSAPPLTALDRRMKRRVVSGRETIDQRLDLHGHTQSEAHAALSRFLAREAAKGARLVLVITGKSGVLRRQVPLWLALPELRASVIGFETAHVAHGGEGALYVRLRRSR